MTPTSKRRGGFDRSANMIAFFSVHALCFLAILTGVDWTAAAMCAGLFLLRKFAITAGYHRYFSHRTFKTSRFFQFLLALVGTTATQKGPLWWASHHRDHHRYSDTPKDIHSPIRRGFWWSHVGWILSAEYDATDYKVIPDYAKYPELRWLNDNFLAPPMLLGLLCFTLYSWKGLVWGYFISTTILWHTTFFINSAAHLMGRKRFRTKDESRNSVILAFLTLGEGWHNNHHRYPSSVNQGFYWWEVDITYYVLKGLALVGMVWDLRKPPQRILEEGLGKQAAAPRRALVPAREPVAIG